MYCISDEQVAYILNDIRRNGIELEDLQLNLLDHICCILEQELKEGDDFERFYKQTVRQFYKNELREIEEETIILLTFKNFYAMKKVMIASGIFSAIMFIIGSMFKLGHMPGTIVFVWAAIFSFSFVFLPLVFVLKVKEAKSYSEKWIVSTGTLTGILYCCSVLFALENWPGRTMLWLSTVCVSIFLFIPVYFFTGIRRPETKINTIMSTTLLVAATCLLFMMIRIRP
ncbi:MAG: hypothetical protein JSS96_15340 [Bacteroidetes bacterium]|nr:hypothetical protein [Bacteroidota bacterium]